MEHGAHGLRGRLGNGKVALTLDKWNAKTPKDGNDSLAPAGQQP